GLGLNKISTLDEQVLEMIKDFSEISKLDIDVLDDEQNAQDLSEIIEFVRMGTLFVQEVLQPSKQDYISPDTFH
ncbi:MAG TPA: YecA family protein, partial [Gammaproteobacteria bacterium]|nr:YecA family protein [Gammaproteobacteria bacterium]